MSELGQALREAREKKGLSLDKLQEVTKIQRRYLQAIEEGRFEQLPGAFYTRAFIKNYAEALGFDFPVFAEEHASEMPKIERETRIEVNTPPPEGGEAPELRALRRARSTKTPVNWSSMLNKAIVIVCILIVLVIVYIVLSHAVGNAGASRAAKQSTGASVSFSGHKTTSAQGTSHASKHKRSSSSSASSSSASSDQSQQLKLDQTTGNRSTYTLTGTDKFVVTLTAKSGQTAWFMATNGQSGAMIVQGTMSDSGQKSYQFDASSVQSLQLKFGNALGTQMQINDQPFTFAAQGTVQYVTINFSK
ncbi:MAG: helix-turn-helix domain-containing protein [Sporolactobacillus sp.]